MRLGRSGPSLAAILLLAGLVYLLAGGGLPGGAEGGGGADEPGESARAVVKRVVDGDTIEVSLDGEEEDVRYIGIDTPESVVPGEPVECFGKAASAENERLVGGETVRLEFDRERRDQYGRLLAYVHVGGTFVNRVLVERGYATTLEIEPNTSRAADLERLEVEAGRRGAGLWGACE